MLGTERAVHAEGLYFPWPSCLSFYEISDAGCHREARAETTSSSRKVIWCLLAQESTTGATFPGHSSSGNLLGRIEEDLQAVSFFTAAPHQKSCWTPPEGPFWKGLARLGKSRGFHRRRRTVSTAFHTGSVEMGETAHSKQCTFCQ